MKEKSKALEAKLEKFSFLFSFPFLSVSCCGMSEPDWENDGLNWGSLEELWKKEI